MKMLSYKVIYKLTHFIQRILSSIRNINIPDLYTTSYNNDSLAKSKNPLNNIMIDMNFESNFRTQLINLNSTLNTANALSSHKIHIGRFVNVKCRRTRLTITPFTFLNFS